jgi:hypothetical protein
MVSQQELGDDRAVPSHRAFGVDPWLVFALLLAAAFRLEDITQPLIDAFSWREASTAMMADNFHNRSWNVFFPEVSWSGPGPSYQGREFQITSYLTALLFQLFGWHDWFGRVISAGFGVATTLFCYLVVKRCWAIDEARVAALVLAFLPGAAAIDRSFLPDPSMLAFVTAGFWLFLRYLDTDRLGWLAGGCACLALGVLAKMPGIAIGLPVLYVLVTRMMSARPLTRSRLTLTVLAGTAAVLLVGLYYGWALHLARNYPPYHMAGSGYIWSDGLDSFVDQRFFASALFETLGDWYVTLPVLILAVAGLLLAPPRRADKDGIPVRWAIHFWLAGATIVYLAAAREIVNNPWNLHIFSVPVAAFVAHALVVIATGRSDTLRPGGWLRLASLCIVLVVIGNRPSTVYTATPYAAAGYALGTRLEDLTVPGDLVVAISSTVGDPVAIYYSRRRGWVFPPGGGDNDWSVFASDDDAVGMLEALRAEGAGWFGVARNARDSEGRRFFEHHKNLVEHLETTATEKFEDDAYVIYRLQ